MEWEKLDFNILSNVYHDFFEMSIDGLLVINDKKQIRAANSAAENLFNFTTDELINKNVCELLPLIHQKEFNELCTVFLASGERRSGHKTTLPFLKKDGSEIFLEISLGNHISSSEGPLMIILLSDVSIKEKTFKALEKLNELLEQKIKERTSALTEALKREKENNELKSRFVSTASHEFRTPLASLLSSVSLIEKYTSNLGDERLIRHFNKIKSSVANLTEILDDFLSVEKIEKGKEIIVNEHFFPAKLIDQACEEIKGRLKEGQKIHYTHFGNGTIYQDKKKIYHTILNILSNASKYSERNKSIDVISKVKGNMVIINIKDEGIGIPENDQSKLFNLFHRAKNAQAFQGTGLGLCIAKNYMELIGGNLTFKSKENEGSIFTISFPVLNH